MADALASGASGSNTVWVQVPSPALENEKTQAMPESFSFSDAEASIEPMGSISCMNASSVGSTSTFCLETSLNLLTFLSQVIK